MNRERILRTLRKILAEEEKILFAYLYGSQAAGDASPGSDLDVAVYLKPAEMKDYLKTEAALTGALVTGLHRDDIDLRIINTLPFLMRYKIIKEGILIIVRDESERVDFETRVMNRYFELKPYLEEYDQMFTSRISAGAQPEMKGAVRKDRVKEYLENIERQLVDIKSIPVISLNICSELH